MDFDPGKALRSLVLVGRGDEGGEGCGVVCNGMVVTAAHVLPGWGDADFWGERPVRIREFDKPESAGALGVVCFSEACGDLAVIQAEPGVKEDPRDELFETLYTHEEAALSLQEFPSSVVMERGNPIFRPSVEGLSVRFWTRQNGGAWIGGTAVCPVPNAPFFEVKNPDGKHSVAGDSGTAVFDDDGGVVGVISHGGGEDRCARLLTGLSGWMLTQLGVDWKGGQ